MKKGESLKNINLDVFLNFLEIQIKDYKVKYIKNLGIKNLYLIKKKKKNADFDLLKENLIIFIKNISLNKKMTYILESPELTVKIYLGLLFKKSINTETLPFKILKKKNIKSLEIKNAEIYEIDANFNVRNIEKIQIEKENSNHLNLFEKIKKLEINKKTENENHKINKKMLFENIKYKYKEPICEEIKNTLKYDKDMNFYAKYKKKDMKKEKEKIDFIYFIEKIKN